MCSGVQPLTSSIVLDTAGTNLETGTVATYLCSVAENDECTTLTIETLISTQYAIECEPNYSESGTEICPNPCGGLVNSNCFYGGGLNNILSVKSSGSSGGGSLWFQPVDSTNGAREVSVAVSVSNLTTANTTDGGDEPSVTTVATVHPPTGDTLSVEADEPNSTGSGERIYTQGEGFEEEYEVKLYHVLNFDDGDSAECYDGGSHHFLSKSKSIVRICDNPF